MVADAYIKLGLSISLGSAVTRKGFERLKQAVVTFPVEKIVIESDSPDQPSPRFEGQLNEPLSIWDVAQAVAQAVAELKKVSPKEILLQSRRNLMRIFGLELSDVE